MSDRDHAAPGDATNAIAPERLAALLDGTLTGQDRERVLKQLAQSPDDVALLANAAAALRDIEGEPESQPKTPARVGEPVPLTWRRKANVRVLIGAAATILVVAGGTWLAIRRTSGAALGPAQYVAMLDDSSDRLPRDWNGQPWTARRSAQDLAVSPRARAVRLGARLVDLQVAVGTSDSATATIAADIARLVAGLPVSTAISERFANIGSRAGETPERLQPDVDAAANAVRIAAGERHVDLGSWLEAARLAAVRRDAAYFRHGTSQSVLGELARDSTATPETRTTAERVRSTVGAQSPAWDRLAEHLTSLLITAGSGL